MTKKNMKIGVDAGCLGIKDERLKVGVYQVVKNLLIELGNLDKDNEYLLYSFETIDKNLMAELGKNFRNIVVRPKRGWMRIWLPLRLTIDRPKIFLALNQSIPELRFLSLDFARDKNDRVGRMKTIGFVYDIAFEEFPEMYVPESVPKMRQNTKKLVKEANSLICISEWTKKEIIRLYKVNANKIQVEYPGVSIGIHLRGGLDRTPLVKRENYFLFIGALKKSKNIPFIIKAFAEFLKKIKKNYNLYLAGGNKWIDNEIQETIKKLNLETKIKILGYVDDKNLPKLYKSAVAFVSPSIYEGFGLTLVEAMASGCPVIAGDNSAQREVVGEAGLLVNVKNVNAIKDAMLSIAKDKNLRLSLIKKGFKRSKLFSWNKFARGVYHRIKKESIDPEINSG